jgi:ATP-dependent DNA helicase RecG
MSTSPARAFDLIEELRRQTGETAWCEFKVNNADPKMIGKTISALANGARLNDREMAYVVWGIDDVQRHVVGASFDPSIAKVGNQGLEMWLAQVLSPCPAIQFSTLYHPDGARVVLLEIPAATTNPVAFEGAPYVRLGSATPPLRDHAEIEATLWTKLRPFAWEKGIAKHYVEGDRVLELLDYASYFTLTKQRLPDNRAGIFERLSADQLVRRDVADRWDILNLGAVLFAHRLSDFPGLDRKSVRLIEYSEPNRTTTKRRYDSLHGYASGFTSLIEQLDAWTPQAEEIGLALRTERRAFPAIAIRELMANALIHQDFTVTGAGPMIELFPGRIEITNPGQPLLEPSRFVDLPPRSRNEALAALMRRMGICEEQGSGVDKVLFAVDLDQLPPPDFREEGASVKVVLYGPRAFKDMTPIERTRACYQHAAVRYLGGEKLTNSSLRERFGLPKTMAATVTRIINETRDARLIKLADASAIKSGYVPFWA